MSPLPVGEEMIASDAFKRKLTALLVLGLAKFKWPLSVTQATPDGVTSGHADENPLAK
jgi:hypothetical protein